MGSFSSWAQRSPECRIINEYQIERDVQGSVYYPGMCDGHQDNHRNFSDNSQRAEPYQEQSEAKHYNQI